MAKELLAKLNNITSSTQNGGTQYCIRFPSAKLQIIVGKASFTGYVSTAVDGGKIYVSDQQKITFSNQFSTIFGATVSKAGFAANTGVYGSSFANGYIDLTFWRPTEAAWDSQLEVGYIAVGFYT